MTLIVWSRRYLRMQTGIRRPIKIMWGLELETILLNGIKLAFGNTPIAFSLEDLPAFGAHLKVFHLPSCALTEEVAQNISLLRQPQ